MEGTLVRVLIIPDCTHPPRGGQSSAKPALCAVLSISLRCLLRNSYSLLAPLARAAGGYGRCREVSTGRAVTVFGDASDADYRKILELCRAGKGRLETIKRFDMPGFRPSATYMRELERFGILSASRDESAPINVYAAEDAYWRSLWRPAP